MCIYNDDTNNITFLYLNSDFRNCLDNYKGFQIYRVIIMQNNVM